MAAEQIAPVKPHSGNFCRYCGFLYLEQQQRRLYYVIMCICAAWFVLVAACLVIFSRRLCTYAVIEESHIQSFLPTSQILCTISTTDAVYYAIFTSPEGSAHGKEFIAISNSPFEYQETYGIAKVRFLQHYDMAKQIVLPFDDQTFKLLDIQKWHNVK